MFTRRDFSINAAKLKVIALSQMNIDPLTPFATLQKKQQREANKIVNDYISKLPPDNWEDIITTDFKLILNEDVFEDLHKKCKTMYVRPATSDELQNEPEEFRNALDMTRTVQQKIDEDDTK